MTKYQKMMIRAVQALNVLKRLASEDDWNMIVNLLEIEAIKLAKERGVL